MMKGQLLTKNQATARGSQGADRDASKDPESPDKSLLWKLGPGLITGAADDDPSGIATYSQVGAQYGYGMRIRDDAFFVYRSMAAHFRKSARESGRIGGIGIAEPIFDGIIAKPYLYIGIMSCS